MSRHHAPDPVCTERRGAVELLVEGRSRDLGGFSVRRVLPSPARRTVGPFIFLDEMGPADLPPGRGINVRPHPHIGLATVTFLFSGEILHRDSLGFVQPIEPGAVNLMTAGRGIVHSERTPPELEATGQHLHGIQTWIALPDGSEELEPAFVHYPRAVLPVVEGDGVETTVVIGRFDGAGSPVTTHADTLYLVQQLDAGADVAVPDRVAERAVYVVSGRVELGDGTLEPGTMAVLRPGEARVRTSEPSRILIVGGEPVGPRHIWWNFVHSSAERIERAKADWRNGVFDRVPGDDEPIPLPED